MKRDYELDWKKPTILAVGIKSGIYVLDLSVPLDLEHYFSMLALQDPLYKFSTAERFAYPMRRKRRCRQHLS